MFSYKEHYWDSARDDDAIIIDGMCYKVREDNSSRFKKDHYLIRMHDGRFIETNELWCFGEVPEDLHIKDNANFCWLGKSVTEKDFI